MDLPLQLAVLVTAQLAILSVPYFVLLRIFFTPPDPDGDLDQALVARSARWAASWPLTAVLGVVGVLWLDTPYDVIVMIYLAMVARLTSSQARLSVRSLPVLTQAYRVLVVPPLVWLAVYRVALSLSDGASAGGWVWGGAVALAGPPLLVAVLASVACLALVLVKRAWYARVLHGRWAISTGPWFVCNLWRDDDEIVLVFTERSVLLPPQTGERPHFVVRLIFNRDWQPDESRLRQGPLADYPGPGPIKAAIFLFVAEVGIRGARARLDDELVATVYEVDPGGDDLFAFITSVQPAGRPRRRR